MKRGMSSLIAVVLLIGFTVILSVLILSFNTEFFNNVIGSTQEKINYECNNVNFRIKDGCYNSDNITLLVENTGGIDLDDGFYARIYVNGKVYDIPTLPSIKIKQYETKNINLLYSGLDKEVKLELTYRIKNEKGIQYCGDNSDSYILGECSE